MEQMVGKKESLVNRFIKSGESAEKFIEDAVVSGDFNIGNVVHKDDEDGEEEESCQLTDSDIEDTVPVMGEEKFVTVKYGINPNRKFNKTENKIPVQEGKGKITTYRSFKIEINKETKTCKVLDDGGWTLYDADNLYDAKQYIDFHILKTDASFK